jgi:hypothetical protein
MQVRNEPLFLTLARIVPKAATSPTFGAELPLQEMRASLSVCVTGPLRSRAGVQPGLLRARLLRARRRIY